MYGYVMANTSPDFDMSEKTCDVKVFASKELRDKAAYAAYSSLYEESKDEIDRMYTKRKLSEKQFIKQFDNDAAVCIQYEDYHVNFEPFSDELEKADRPKSVPEMSPEERKTLELAAFRILSEAITDDYAKTVLTLEEYDEDDNPIPTIMDDIVDDVCDSSAWRDENYYNDDDVRFAIGRVLIARLGYDKY